MAGRDACRVDGGCAHRRAKLGHGVQCAERGCAGRRFRDRTEEGEQEANQTGHWEQNCNGSGTEGRNVGKGTAKSGRNEQRAKGKDGADP
jgi:hypothetical protein